MIQVYDTILVTRNARDKIQTARYILEQDGNSYTIRRFTGQFGGKITTQPEKHINAGKAKRTVLQQAELEYNSLVKKAMDKGYKKLASLTKTKYEEITSKELDEIVPSIKTDAAGNIKPQLAKSSNDCAISVFNKPMYCSRKIDGVRALLKRTEKIGSVSRGGKNYDPALEHLFNNEKLIEFFETYPDVTLDGEIYYHGWPLQKISGTARLKTWEERCEKLEFWIFDIADMDKTFEERLELLEEIKDFFEGEEQIKVLEHIKVEGWASYKRLHDKFVAEGFEGLVARKPDKKYAAGKRNSDWIKLKEYQDDEFEITGISEGLRPEDMCFVLVTKDGKSFEAKPIGPRELKYEYLDNWPILVGKMATVKFFDYSSDGIPTQTVLKSIREEE